MREYWKKYKYRIIYDNIGRFFMVVLGTTFTWIVVLPLIQ